MSLQPDTGVVVPTRTPVPTAPAGLHAVPDLVAPLGAGLLPEETSLDQELVCHRVLQVTHDVVTVVLAPTRPGGFAFSPGQYLTLTAQVDGRPVERCYTISSPPTRPHLLTITVKRTPGGQLSTWLHDRLRPGDRLQARGPHGSFTVVDHAAPRYLLLSAGSGITPTLATLRTMADLAEPADVVVVHSARTPDDLAYRAEIEALAAAGHGMRVHWICEDADPAWAGLRGRLTPDLLRELVPDLHDREVLSCGPPGYMAALRDHLGALAVDPVRCHEESFVLDAPGAPAVSPPVVVEGPGPVAGQCTIRFGRSGREVSCSPGTTVLEAAQGAGVPLPSSCSQGLCGTCKSTLLSGEVDMNHQGGIRPREVAQGKFLPCCSTPSGDIVVDA